MARFDLVLVGGGLQSGLIALATLSRRPAARIAVVERAGTLGGNHTWCFHDSAVPADARPWLEPLVVQRWADYEVAFPRRRRAIAEAYSAVSSERLDEVVCARLSSVPGCEVATGAEAVEIGSGHVLLAGGRRLEGEVVVDARGPDRPPASVRTAYQKFVGLEVVPSRGELPARPLLMDATVAQRDGFRFLYVLPYDDGRALVEETRFSASPALDREEVRAGVLDYLARRGVGVNEVVREEHGVLLMPWQRWHEEPSADAPLRAGARGGFFHPATGYSFGPAVRLASALAEAPPGRAAALAALAGAATAHEKQARFARTLNRMVFRGYRPADWWRVFEWFHGMPEGVIRRFHALEMTGLDRARIFLGGPPAGVSLVGVARG